ncbi:GNAT family N-acetyltransferase [Sediminibacterium ginsengisoli]|uniref:N-acetylglutamate synthase, GNAT family n=1 Tax=Sediminibacterium ginsengisoli TaxID=413434 RepID=A0A1T4QCF2_9BACT|nr:GNAT family N-acetyltransferase [Sediminibacterium ginsengisoli]SKA01409.1 N-acetylglutamate synthase, GNAT family [Sediminibacterium ginsengisoli]
MEDNIIIRPLTNGDCAAIQALILPIQQIEFNIPITLEKQPDLLNIEKNYHATGGGFWGALAGEKLVGTIAMIGIGGGAGAIRKMFVEKEWRGKEKQIAQQLLAALIGYSRTNGITNLYLGTVDVLKAAQRFYERNGFQPIQKSAMPANFPFMAPDTVFYHLDLTTYA